MTTIDQRELITMDYKLMGIEQLKQLKKSLWHSITKQQSGVVAMHHEYNIVSIALKDLEEAGSEPIKQAELPVNTDLLEPEYVAWKGAGE